MCSRRHGELADWRTTLAYEAATDTGAPAALPGTVGELAARCDLDGRWGGVKWSTCLFRQGRGRARPDRDPCGRRSCRAAGGDEVGVEAAFGDLDIMQGDVDELGHDDLSALGLDSIHVMRLVEGWRAKGAEIGFVQLTKEPTLHNWANRLRPA